MGTTSLVSGGAHQHLIETGTTKVPDGEGRAAVVSILLAVLYSNRHTQPVVDTGSLFTWPDVKKRGPFQSFSVFYSSLPPDPRVNRRAGSVTAPILAAKGVRF